MSHRQMQRGTVLVISLIMLVVMTLLAISAINMSTVNLRIVGNMQAQLEAESSVQDALETIISDLDYFKDPTTVPATVNIGNYDVAIDTPLCVQAGPAPGFEAAYSIGPAVAGTRFDNDWIVQASNSTSARGETVTITQGVRVREMLAACL